MRQIRRDQQKVIKMPKEGSQKESWWLGFWKGKGGDEGRSSRRSPGSSPQLDQCPPHSSPTQRANSTVCCKMSLIHIWNPPSTNRDPARHTPFMLGTQPQPAPCPQHTKTFPLKAYVGHSDRMHLSTEPSPVRSSGSLWLTPTQGPHLGCSMPDLPENPQIHPNSSITRSPQRPHRHWQMVSM